MVTAELSSASFDANAATLILEVLVLLRQQKSRSGTAAAELALAMPFSDADDEGNTASARRCLIMIDAIKDLRAQAQFAYAERKSRPPPAIDELRSLFEQGIGALNNGGTWFRDSLQQHTFSALEAMTPFLPYDRHRLPAQDRADLVQALASLRAAHAKAGPVFRRYLAELIAQLEQAILKTFTEGRRPVVDVMFDWRMTTEIHARRNNLAVPEFVASEDAPIRDTLKSATATLVKQADHAVRVSGLIQLGEQALKLLAWAAD